MNSSDTIGQMLTQCESMNASTTALPRKPGSATVRLCWSVRVNPGARTAGTAVSDMRLTRLVGMLAGIPMAARADLAPLPGGGG
jgi:hypothetical protein